MHSPTSVIAPVFSINNKYIYKCIVCKAVLVTNHFEMYINFSTLF